LGWGRYHGKNSSKQEVDYIAMEVWIQRDGTEAGIALDLENAGIPKEHIVLGFKPPEVRSLTGYGVA
jgi:XisI protein